ncbi:MAG: hypothetical protein JWQ49_5713 [Edaphobacter sp.]|nr:hypothetical protein [Edaphobacter sp.]
MRLEVRHQIFPNEGRWFSPAANLRILATISTFLSTHLPDSHFGNLSCDHCGTGSLYAVADQTHSPITNGLANCAGISLVSQYAPEEVGS